MTEEKGSVQRAEFEDNRTEHESMMARMAADHEANRIDHEANRIDHEANRAAHESMMARMTAGFEANRVEHESMMARMTAGFEANRVEHESMMARLDGLDRAMVKLGVEFEQHRRDTRVLADGILGLVRDPLSVTASLAGAG